MGRHRGTEIWNYIEEILDDQNEQIIIINLVDANPLQYTFCQYAFGPLIELLSKSENSRAYVLFKMKQYHVNSFFHGLLRYFNITSSLEDAKIKFEEHKMHVKILYDDCKIEYVGQLNRQDSCVLNVINKSNGLSIRSLADACDLTDEAVHESLERLMKFYFIISLVIDKNKRYYSIQSFIDGGANAN